MSPTYKYVLLKADNSIEDILVDESVRANHVEKILNGPIELIGQYDLNETGDIGLVLIKSISKYNQSMNAHKLLKPFNNQVVYGDILINYVNEDGQSSDFTKDDYIKFLNTYDYDNIMKI